MATVRTVDELNSAINRGDDTIEINGDFANKVFRIKATGKVAWAVAIGLISIAFYVIITIPVTAPATGGGSAPAQGFAAIATGGGAAAILGGGTAAAAIALAVTAGGAGVLRRLRSDYKILEQADGRVVLQKL